MNNNTEEYFKALKEIEKLFNHKHKLYGDNWRKWILNENGLGPRAIVSQISLKFARLVELAWKNDPKNNLPRIMETFRDMANYAIMGYILSKDAMTEEDRKKFLELDKTN